MSGVTTTTWERIPARTRKSLVWTLWFVTWLGLLGGLYDRSFYTAVVVFTVGHALLFLVLHGFQVGAFPVQVRLTYVLWVVVGTYVPHMTFLMYISTVGLVGNLFFSYCPLARMLYLLPWNRSDPLSMELVTRIVLTPPVNGRFKPASKGA